jgi:hypothetical protein
MSGIKNIIDRINKNARKEFVRLTKVSENKELVEAMKKLKPSEINNTFVLADYPFYIFTPLKYAVFVRNEELVDSILSKNPNVSFHPVDYKKQYIDTTSALNLALDETAHVNGDYMVYNKVSNSIAIKLIKAFNPKERRQAVNYFTLNKTTPLIECCYTGNTEVGKVLLENGADKNLKNNFDLSPEEICFNRGHTVLGSYIKYEPYRQRSLYSVKEEYCILKTAKELKILPVDVIEGISDKYKPDDSWTFNFQSFEYKFKGNYIYDLDEKFRDHMFINTSQLSSPVGIFIPEGVKKVSFVSEHHTNPNLTVLKLWGVKFPKTIEEVMFFNQTLMGDDYMQFNESVPLVSFIECSIYTGNNGTLYPSGNFDKIKFVNCTNNAGIKWDNFTVYTHKDLHR